MEARIDDSSSHPLLRHLLVITDFRREGSTDHPLMSILLIAVCAVICDADGWTGIARWGEAKKEWLSTFLELPYGVPSHNTFRRVFSIIGPDALAEAFAAWMADVTELTQGAVVAINGKTLRRASNKAANHMVSAFAAENSVVLGQVKTAEKSNEITAIPQLLTLLKRKGCLVTIDAMGCQRDIAEQIVAHGSDDLLSV